MTTTERAVLNETATMLLNIAERLLNLMDQDQRQKPGLVQLYEWLREVPVYTDPPAAALDTWPLRPGDPADPTTLAGAEVALHDDCSAAGEAAAQ